MNVITRTSVVLVVLAMSVAAGAQEKPAKPDVWPLADEAAALIAKKDFAGARTIAEKMIALDAQQGIGHTMRIYCLEQIGDGDAVIAACDALAKTFPMGQEVKKPDPLRQHQLWHYHAEGHKAEALMRLKRFDDAAGSFSAAGKLAFDAARPMDAGITYRWQIAMKNRQADALFEGGKREEAVQLRRDILRKFDGNVLACNNCVRVKAALVRNLRAMDEADEAAKVLDAALADKRLDDVQKSWLKATVDGKKWSAPSPTDTLAATTTPDAFVIRSEGRFELRVNLGTRDRYAMLTSWYDLETDPLREVDLADDNWFSLFKPHHVGYQELVDGKWTAVPYNRYRELQNAGKLGVGYTKDQNRFEVIESSAARVQWRVTNAGNWPGEVHTYTIYPDGRLYIGTHWSVVNADKTIKILRLGYYTGVSGTINWRCTIGDKTGMFGSPYISNQAPLTMMHSNEHYPTVLDATRADLVKCLVKPSSSYGNNTLFLAWFRSPSGVTFDPEAHETADVSCFIQVWPNDRDSFEAALPYVADYQDPAKLEVRVGTLVTDDAGDYNRDGFNEAEGCYVVRADANAVELTIDGSKVNRFSPVFKILDVTGTDHSIGFTGRTGGKTGPTSVHIDPKTKTAIVRLTHPVLSVGRLDIPFR